MSSALHFEHTNDAGRPLQQCRIGRPHGTNYLDVVTNHLGYSDGKEEFILERRSECISKNFFHTVIHKMSLEPVMGTVAGAEQSVAVQYTGTDVL